MCLKCGFPLHDVPNAAYLPPKEYECPECGRPYKPGRAKTYHDLHDGPWPGPHIGDWKVLLITVIVLVVIVLGLWILSDPRLGLF